MVLNIPLIPVEQLSLFLAKLRNYLAQYLLKNQTSTTTNLLGVKFKSMLTEAEESRISFFPKVLSDVSLTYLTGK